MDLEEEPYLDPREMPEGSFEKECWMLARHSALNITIAKERQRLISHLEKSLHVLNRVKAAKMKRTRANAVIKIPKVSEERLRIILDKLREYKFVPPKKY